MIEKLFTFAVPADAEFECNHDPVTGNVQVTSTNYGFGSGFNVKQKGGEELLEFCQQLNAIRLEAEQRRRSIAERSASVPDSRVDIDSP